MRTYIGLGLIPPVGVSLGLDSPARDQFPSIGETIFCTVVATTVAFELARPISTRTALGSSKRSRRRSPNPRRNPRLSR
ncbi:MAG: hypothetical protein WCY97_08360 [Methanothrix sp.]|uniref:Uncharacterized protein n=1 Tax=Methanothrix harundinacea TaxID=301375 RepID=A0A124FMD8_9EURY|nr:MAG: hypothetical protein XD72_1217 [Methanothrix harundinacea]MCP1392086.1 hypothetical protein [Methanothrix harundinacea]MDD3710838.1 hypothetical protein [Methanothrix sp.]MDD5769150.1 hypothetical protein [Methanothrix sp.]MDI9398071.1 hypothetical protein [Euryarchaeota archaeon]